MGGMFVTGGVSCILGKKDKAVSVRRRNDYVMRLKWISKKFVVLYDVLDRRAWMVDGVSALLHLVRASLKKDETDPFKDLSLYDESRLQEAPEPGTGKTASIFVLTDENNTSLPLYAKPSSTKEETSRHDTGTQSRIISLTQSNYTLRERIENICDTLEQMIAHQADVSTQDGVGFRITKTVRRQLEGFDFMDVATDEDPIWPHATTLRATGRGWVDFTRAIHAVTLFGSGFGELFRPRETSTAACAGCQLDVEVPKGQDYLAVCAPDLQDIIQRRGSKNVMPWRLVDDIYWHTPDKTFEACQCAKFPASSHDRVQVLLPSSFPKLLGRKLKSPNSIALDGAPRGALLFEHSRRFPLLWRDYGVPVEGEPEFQEVAELEASFNDSGIGTSLEGSSVGDGADGTSTSSGSPVCSVSGSPPVPEQPASEPSARKRKAPDERIRDVGQAVKRLMSR